MQQGDKERVKSQLQGVAFSACVTARIATNLEQKLWAYSTGGPYGSDNADSLIYP
jgi:hypothetical protein